MMKDLWIIAHLITEILRIEELDVERRVGLLDSLKINSMLFLTISV